MQQASLSSFLLAISEVHSINIDVDPILQGIPIINNFKDVLVSDVLVYLCKTYELTIDFTGSILYVTPFEEELEEGLPEERTISIDYNPSSGLLSLDLQKDNIAEAFKLISERTGKGLFFTPDLASNNVSAFIKDLPIAIAMEKIAYSNDLIVAQTKDGSFEFEAARVVPTSGNGVANRPVSRPARPRRANFFFKVLNADQKTLDVDIQNVAVLDIIYDIGNELELDIFTASPLDNAGVASVKASNINFDQLLTKIFENSQLAAGSSTAPNPTNGRPVPSVQERFTFKKENGVYYFGTYRQLTLRDARVIPMRYRSLAILSDPQQSGRSAGRSNGFGNSGNFGNFNTNGFGNQDRVNTNSNLGRNNNQNGTTSDQTDISQLIPEDIKQDLNIITDKELNSFIVSGASSDIARFKEFVTQIDNPVPDKLSIEFWVVLMDRVSLISAK